MAQYRLDAWESTELRRSVLATAPPRGYDDRIGVSLDLSTTTRNNTPLHIGATVLRKEPE